MSLQKDSIMRWWHSYVHLTFQSLATYEVLDDLNVVHAMQPKRCHSQVDLNVSLRHANVLSSLTSSCDSARSFGETFWFMTSLVSLSRSFPWLIRNNVCLWSVSIASMTFSERVSTWVFPSFDTYSCMSVKVLTSPVGSNDVTNYVDSAAAMTKSPRRALTMALPLVIWVALFGSYNLMATDQQRNIYTLFLIIIWVLQCHPELEPRYWLKSVQDGRHLEIQDGGQWE